MLKADGRITIGILQGLFSEIWRQEIILQKKEGVLEYHALDTKNSTFLGQNLGECVAL